MHESRAQSRQAATFALLAVAGFALASLAAIVALAASGSADLASGRITIHVLVAATPLAAGAVALVIHRSERFAWVLVLAGLVWSASLLAEARSGVLHSIGDAAAWATLPALLALVLAFPGGRIRTGRDRVLITGATLLLGALAVASIAVSTTPQAPWAACGPECPRNAATTLDGAAGGVAGALLAALDVAVIIVLIGVTAALVARLRGARNPRRATLGPVAPVMAGAAIIYAGYVAARRLGNDESAAEVLWLSWWAMCLPAVALAFTVGLLRRRLLLGGALTELSRALPGSHAPQALGTALRSSLNDTSAEVLVRDRMRGRWLHLDGSVADLAGLVDHGHVLHEIGDDRDGPFAALVVEQDLDDEEELVTAIAALAESWLREDRLRSQLERSLHDLAQSRTRIATAADGERRRIERDLHDGAQQRLIALRMRLSLAEELLAQDVAVGAGAVHELGAEVDLALEEIRALANGIYPALLSDRGLEDALRSASRHATLPVRLGLDGVGRHAPEVESAVYFTCLEAMQNAAKHARGATHLAVTLRRAAGELELEVADDGAGFDHDGVVDGAGLRNMRDRIESVGGHLEVRPSARGTTVSGGVPLPGRHASTPGALPRRRPGVDQGHASSTTVPASRS